MDKTIVISDVNDEVVILMYPDRDGHYIVVEPADGSLKAEVYNGTEPMFHDENGRIFIDRSRFIFRI